VATIAEARHPAQPIARSPRARRSPIIDPVTPAPIRHPTTVPPGYPPEYERDVRLSDGRTVLVRPIIPADRGPLAYAIRTADPDTVHRRFLGSPPRITPQLLTYLCTVDYRHRFALVAIDPATGAGIAVARYETTADGIAEVAVARREPAGHRSARSGRLPRPRIGTRRVRRGRRRPGPGQRDGGRREPHHRHAVAESRRSVT
jgi:hypothetical protein